jgi:hypothetical protein
MSGTTTMLTKEALAARLNGREYGKEITKAEGAEAKAAGLIVAFGYSDDNLELRGAMDDEVSAYDLCEIGVTAGLIIVPKDDHDIDDPDELIRKGWTPPKAVFTIKAEWCPDDLETSWRITSSLPYASFDVMEDGALFCRGIVIDTKDIPQ